MQALNSIKCETFFGQNKVEISESYKNNDPMHLASHRYSLQFKSVIILDIDWYDCLQVATLVQLKYGAIR